MKEKLTRQAVSGLFGRAENLRDYPGEYFPALAEARAAMKQWREENPEEAAAEDAEREAWKAKEEARRKKDFENSFIGRQLD